MIYLASPYSHPSPLVRDLRYTFTAEFVIKKAQQGHLIFSPIMYFHPFSHGIPADFPIQTYDDMFMRMCSSVWVLKLLGWEQSVGIAHEIDLAEKLGLRVTYMERNS